MGLSIPYGDGVVIGLPTSKSIPVFSNQISVQRLPTDPVYQADVTIDNAEIGTRYWLVNDSDFSQVLSTGLITADPHILTNIPAFSDPFLMFLRLRKSSVSPLFKQFETKIKHSPIGSSTFVIQESDE